jgi:hypothetical protein
MGIKQSIKRVLRPFYRGLRYCSRPLVRGFLTRLSADLPTRQQMEYLINLLNHKIPEFQQHLHNIMHHTIPQLQQQMHQLQVQYEHQMKQIQAVLRENDQMLLALLKSPFWETRNARAA